METIQSLTEASPTAAAPRRFHKTAAVTTNSSRSRARCPRQGRGDSLEIENEGCRVDRHVEDGGGKREPCFLEAPERAQRTTHPGVEAALVGDGGGEFAEHERGGETPEERKKKERQQSEVITAAADDILEVIGTPGDHEIGRREERDEA